MRVENDIPAEECCSSSFLARSVYNRSTTGFVENVPVCAKLETNVCGEYATQVNFITEHTNTDSDVVE